MRRIAPVLVSLALLGVACGDDDETADTTPTVCEARNQLRDDVQALADVDVVAEGVNAWDAQLNVVRDDVEQLRTAASADLRPEVDAVTAAFDALNNDVEAATTLADKASAASTGFSELADAVQTLVSSLTQQCD